jgi:tRNA G18 (ribose-2'-O)-methylase SpoU
VTRHAGSIVIIERIAAFDDPRLDDYRNLKDNLLQERSNRFVAESLSVVAQLLQSNLQVNSILTTETRWQRLAQTAAFLDRATKPFVYIVEQSVMDEVTGFNVHRGCLAIGERPAAPTFTSNAQLIVALEDLVDVDNVGAIVRHACAFGADGLLLSPKAADPYYRKAIRVAMGNTFHLPIVRTTAWPADLIAWKARLGAQIIGTVVQPEGAHSLRDYQRKGEPCILVFGCEGDGLSRTTRNLCDELVTIPMAKADSLNVATAAAVFLFQLTQG